MLNDNCRSGAASLGRRDLNGGWEWIRVGDWQEVVGSGMLKTRISRAPSCGNR
jgi:hypothetical protein